MLLLFVCVCLLCVLYAVVVEIFVLLVFGFFLETGSMLSGYRLGRLHVGRVGNLFGV